MVKRAVLVAHGAGGHTQLAVVQRAHQHVLVHAQAGRGQLLGKAPDLAPAGDRRVVVEEHVVRVSARLAVEGDRDHLARLGVVAEAGGVGHADEFHLDDGAGRGLQRRGHHGGEQLGVGAVADDHELAVDEAVGPARIDRAGQWHGPGLGADIGEVHDGFSGFLRFETWRAIEASGWWSSTRNSPGRSGPWRASNCSEAAMSAPPACQCSVMDRCENS